MAGRGRDQNRDVLDRITAVLDTLVQERDVEPAEHRGLMAFRKNHPPKFSGDYDCNSSILGFFFLFLVYSIFCKRICTSSLVFFLFSHH